MKKDKYVINIDGKNDNKSDIVYNNVVSSMEDMSMSQEEQIEYLKSRISDLEHGQKMRFDFIILGLICFFALIIGVTFMILNFYIFGILIVFSTCFIGIYQTYKLSCNSKFNGLDKFEEIESIRKFISSKLK